MRDAAACEAEIDRLVAKIGKRFVVWLLVGIAMLHVILAAVAARHMVDHGLVVLGLARVFIHGLATLVLSWIALVWDRTPLTENPAMRLHRRR